MEPGLDLDKLARLYRVGRITPHTAINALEACGCLHDEVEAVMHDLDFLTDQLGKELCTGI